MFIILTLLGGTPDLPAQQLNPALFNDSDSTTISGKIDGYSVSQEEQFINYYWYDITGRQQKMAVPLQKDGKFNFRFLQQYEGDFGLKYGANFIKAYAVPGEKIEIEIDHHVADKEYHFPGAFKIKGASAVISRHMLQFFAIYLPMMQERAAGFDMKKPVEEFIDWVHRNLQSDLALLAAYITKNDPPETFRSWATNWLTYEAAGMIVTRPFLGRDRTPITDTQLNGYLRNIPLVNEQAFHNASYYEFLSRWVGSIQMLITNNAGYRLDLATSTRLALQKIDQYLGGIFRELAYYYCYAFNAHSEAATIKLEQDWDQFDAVINDPYLQQALELKRSSSAKNFTPYNVIDSIRSFPVDAEVKKGLLAILEQEKGHYVFIDFWGSWCRPCMGEMPYYKAFIEELKDMPVTFIFLAVETSLKDIRATQEKYAIPGKFLSLNKNDTDIANQVFGFSGYPSHFLIDPAGKLLTRKLALSVNNKQDAVAQLKWFIK